MSILTLLTHCQSCSIRTKSLKSSVMLLFKIFFVHAAILILSTVRLISADPILWNSQDGIFTDPLNWTPRTPPTPETPIEISGGISNWIAIGGAQPSRAGDSRISGGKLSITGTFRNAHGAPATLQVEGGELQHSGNFFVLAHDAEGTLVQTGGKIYSHVVQGFFFSDIGRSSASAVHENGEMEIEFEQVDNLEERRQYILGKAGSDRWTINGGKIRLRANNDFADGHLIDSERQRRSFIIRRNSRIEVNNGELTFDLPDYVCFGYKGSGEASFIMNGGRVEIVRSRGSIGGLVLGYASEGLLGVTGGNLVVQVEQPSANRERGLTVGHEGGFGIVQQSGGAVDLLGLDLVLGNGIRSAGQYSLSGGYLRAKSIRRGDGQGLFRFLGGEIRLEGDQTSLASESFFEIQGSPEIFYESSINQTIFRFPQ